MFTVVGAYIKNIALIMLLAILAEMAAPDAKIKKYVSITIGIVMIFAVGGKVFSILGIVNEAELSVPTFNVDMNNSTDTYDIREKLTGIIYEEISSQKDQVDDYSVNNDGLDIRVERVSLYE